MRIVCIADTHLYEEDLEMPRGDLLIHAGDMLRRGTLEELRYAAQWLGAQRYAAKVAIAGNHDWAFAREPAQARAILPADVCYLEDGEVTIDGVRIWGSPWQPEFFGWAFNLPRGEALAEVWAKIPSDVDVLVTHGPPRGYGDRTGPEGARREGCDDLLEALARVRPALHVFGHIHEDGGRWQLGPTTIANVTVDEGDRAPSVFDYDPESRTVTPVHVAPGRFSGGG